MKIQQIHVSELGLQLDDLAAGLNVIYGPESSGKTTVARFTQAVLYGLADPSLRFLAPRQGEAVGAVTLSGPRGTETLSRVNDGTQRGELTLESRSSHDYEDYYSGRHHQPDLLNHHYDAGEHLAARWVGGMDEAEFAAVYAVEFPREYSLDRLIDVTLARGAGDLTTSYTGDHYYEYAATVEEERHLDSLDAEVEHLESRRHELHVELDDLQRSAAALRAEAVTTRGRLQDQIAVIEQDQRSRTAELHRVEAEIKRVEEEIAHWWKGLRGENEAATRYATQCVDFLNDQIAQLDRSRSSLQQRADRLEDQMSRPAARDEYDYDPERYSAELERKAHEIDRELATRRSTTYRWANHWRRDDAYTRLTPVLESLQTELTTLAQHMRGNGRVIQNEGLHCELHHVHAKIEETTRQIECLTAQRHYINDRMQPADVHWPEYEAQRRETLEREHLHDLRTHASQLARSIEAANAELDSLRAELARFEHHRWNEHQNRIDHCRAELERVGASVRQAVIAREDFAASLRRIVTRQTHPVTAEASQNLDRLTGGELVRITVDRDSRSIRVEDNTGMYHNANVLSAGSRDLVKLSLCLALASDRSRQQQQPPVLLDDAFRHLPSHCHRAAAELLCDYASRGWQIVLLTSQREIADLMKSYGAPVRNLPVTTPARGVRSYAGPRYPHHRADEYDYRAAQRPYYYGEYRRTTTAKLPEYAWHGALPHHHPASHYTPRWSASRRHAHTPRRSYDDSYLYTVQPQDTPQASYHTPYYGVRQYDRTLPVFSHKLRYSTSRPYHLHRDEAPLRVHRQYEPASARQRETQYEDGYFLRTRDEVTQIPFLEPAVANQLRDLDVYTVEDLLHANAGELAERLSRPNVKHSTVSRWQGMSRLMCEVRNLRSYDARILYACRIYDGQQLASIRPGNLQAMLEEFVATPEGSRLVRSGTTAEIDRLTRWIKGGGTSWRHASWRSSRNGRTHRSSQYSRLRNEAYEGLRTRDEDSDGDSRYATTRNGSSSRSSSSRSSSSRSSSSRSSSHRSRSERGSRQREARRAERQRQRRERDARERDAREYASREREARSTTRRESTPAVSEPAELRFYLSREQEIAAAPSIGPKTAARLEAVGIYTVDDLLNADAVEVADRLNQRRVKASHVRDWQAQARLVCCTPGLRGHDAQILVACGVTTAAQLAAESATALFAKVKPFCQTKEGIRIVRNGKKPDLTEVQEWIAAAGQRRQLAAA